MTGIENLRKETEKALHGLTAGDSLKHRILTEVTQGSRRSVKKMMNPVPVFCTVAAVLIICLVVLNGLQPVGHQQSGDINVFTAGGQDYTLPGFLEILQPEKCSAILIDGQPVTENAEDYAVLINHLCQDSQAAEGNPAGSVQGQTLTLKTTDGEQVIIYILEPYLWKDDVYLECPSFFSALREIYP